MNCAKIIRANNILQIIHQVTIEFRFRKSLAQERFKSNFEFRYQIIVSSVKLKKNNNNIFSAKKTLSEFGIPEGVPIQ